MKRTQIQLPDALFEAAHHVAEQKEISLAELVRRGLEYMIAATPLRGQHPSAWTLPEARDLGSRDPFSDEHWRERIHMERLQAAESRPGYKVKAPKP